MANPEALLLSAVLRTGDVKAAIAQGITPDMFDAFYDEWLWVSQHHGRHGKAPTKSAFQQKFPEAQLYRVDDVIVAAADVRRQHAERSLSKVMDQAIDMMVKGQIEPAMKKLQTDLLVIQSQVMEPTDNDYDLATSWQATYEEVKKRVARVSTMGRAGIPTGFHGLDQATGGLQPGWMTIVGARLGAGKTWTMVQMAAEAALAGYQVCYYSLEQSRHQIAQRSHAIFSRRYWPGGTFRPMDLMRGTGFNLASYREFLAELPEIVPGSLTINDASRGRIGPMQVASDVEREGYDIVFIDYLTLMKMQGDGGYVSIGQLSSSVQQIGQRYEIPMVAASQLNRSAANSEAPGAETLTGADSIGHDADMLLTIAKKSKSVRLMTQLKFRHGPDGGKWFIRWQPNDGIIEECTGDEAGELIERDNEVE